MAWINMAYRAFRRPFRLSVSLRDDVRVDVSPISRLVLDFVGDLGGSVPRIPNGIPRRKIQRSGIGVPRDEPGPLRSEMRQSRS